MYAAASLEEGRRILEARLGVRLEPGGQHEAFGTHNLLLSLGPAYLELIAVDPSAPDPERPRWFELGTPAMEERLARGPTLIHWVASAPIGLGQEAPEFTRGENRWRLTVTPDGRLPLGGVAPSLIEWHTPSPALRLPDAGVRLSALRLGTPEPELLRARLRALGLDGPPVPGAEAIGIEAAPGAVLSATFQTPRGSVTL